MNPNQIQVHPARIVDAITLAAEAGNAEHKVARLERALAIAQEGLQEYANTHSPEWRLSDNGDYASVALFAITKELGE